MSKADISNKVDQIIITKNKSGWTIVERGSGREFEGMVGESHGLTSAYDVQQKISVWTNELEQKDLDVN